MRLRDGDGGCRVPLILAAGMNAPDLLPVG